MIDEKKLIEELKAKIYPERFGERCNAMDVISGVLQVIFEQPKTDWIPCEERLPECEWGCETEPLMFQIKNSDYIEIGYYGEGGEYRDRYFRTYIDTLEGYDASDIIAWQPLPQAYKKEGGNIEM